MTARIYDRPDLDQRRGRLPLRITGTLPNSAPLVAYEGRLQIHNAIGACRAELVAGELPAGYTISVDNETQEIIVAWPAWEPVAQPVFNGDFEMGDVGWEKGAGWAVRHNPPEPKYTGNWAAIFTGGGTSSIMCVPQPCGPGRSISGGVLFDQGSSNKKNVDCYVQLSFYDVSGKVIGNPVWGNKVHKLTNKQRHWSRVTHTSPPQTAAVSIGAMVHRRRYLRPVSADDIYWNLEGSGVGAPEDATYEITIRAFDSAGRSALWSGTVTVSTSPQIKAYEEEVMDSGPVLYWRANDTEFKPGAYPRIDDSSGNGIFGNVSGGVTLQQGALRPGGQSIRHTLTGSTWAWIDENGAPFNLLNLGAEGSATVEIIIQIPTNENLGVSDPAILVKRPNLGASGAREYGMRFMREAPGGLIGINSSIADVRATAFAAWETTLTPGRIVHLASTYQPVSDGVEIKIYADGVLVASFTKELSGPPYATDDPYVLEIGGADFPASWSFASRWSDAAVYPRALSQAEIERHAMAAGRMPIP